MASKESRIDHFGCPVFLCSPLCLLTAVTYRHPTLAVNTRYVCGGCNRSADNSYSNTLQKYYIYDIRTCIDTVVPRPYFCSSISFRFTSPLPRRSGFGWFGPSFHPIMWMIRNVAGTLPSSLPCSAR